MLFRSIPSQNKAQYPLQTVLDSSIRNSPDMGAFVTKSDHSAAIMLWNYHDKDSLIQAIDVKVQLKNLGIPTATLTHYRIDANHSNSYEYWKKIGSPQQPTDTQIKAMVKAAALQTFQGQKSTKIKLNNKGTDYTVSLPSQAVSLLYLSW